MECDVAVIGAGPIGLETAAILQAEGHRVTVFDTGAIGSTIVRCFPPNTRFFTSPERLQLFGQAIDPLNQEKLTGEEYLSYLRSYVATHSLEVRTFQKVISIEGDESNGFVLSVANRAGASSEVRANKIVLATGGTDIPRRLGIAGEDLSHVRSYLGDPHQYLGRKVLIVGGRNSAAESALRCYRAGAETHLCHRSDQLDKRIKYWIKPEVESLIAEGRIVAHMPQELSRIESSAVTFKSGEKLEVDDVVLQLGFEQDKSMFELAGVSYDAELLAPVFDSETMQTDRRSIFVVGTATAGTQNDFGVFIENCHDHGHRVAAALADRPAPPATPARPLPEV